MRNKMYREQSIRAARSYFPENTPIHMHQTLHTPLCFIIVIVSSGQLFYRRTEILQKHRSHFMGDLI
jgi:hypothetical protein